VVGSRRVLVSRSPTGSGPGIVWVAAALCASLACGCAKPVVARDGTVVFQEQGAGGASVLTANGVEYHDRKDVPQRVIVRDPNEPWHAPIGFILPANGRFTATSHPTVLGTPGLAFALRPSDTRVPSWGGEVLVRVDVLAPAAAGEAREAERIVLVLDGGGEDTLALAETVLAQLAGRDHVAVVDATGGRVVVPSMPASHRSLILAAIAKRLDDTKAGSTPSVAGQPPRDLRVDLGGALQRAHVILGDTGTRRLVLLSDGRDGALLTPEAKGSLAAFSKQGLAVTVAASAPDVDALALEALADASNAALASSVPLEARQQAVRAAVPPAGLVVFNDVVLRFEGTPAPSHVLEASGGDVRWRLESGELALGDVFAGETRTEVIRVTVPAWVPGEVFKFTVTARFKDSSRGGQTREMKAEVPCVYDDDIARIARSRHGDVIAYASALATLRRLDAAFVGEGVARAGGLRALAQLHAQSMALLARDMRDASIGEQAELLRALLEATE
jgi:hypothetical protein